MMKIYGMALTKRDLMGLEYLNCRPIDELPLSLLYRTSGSDEMDYQHAMPGSLLNAYTHFIRMFNDRKETILMCIDPMNDFFGFVETMAMIFPNFIGVGQPGGSSDPSCQSSALILAGTFFNHSCDPNIRCFNEFDEHANITFATNRPVKKGEELKISYIDKDKPLDQRHAILQAQYRFKCDCVRCKAKK